MKPTARSPLEIAQRAYVAFDRDDLDGVLADLDDAIVWEQAQGLPHGGTYRGIAAVRTNVFDPLDRDWWDEFSATPHQFIDGGDEIVVLGRYHGTAKNSGRALDVPFVHVWTITGEKVVRFRQFLDTAGWNTALGERDSS
jgi:hypothetical protein